MTSFTDAQLAFLEQNHRAAMITLRGDGSAHAVRVGVALVDAKLWSSGTATRARTKHLRRDARSTVWVFDSQFKWLTVEATVTLLEGADAADLNLKLFRVMQNKASGALSWYGKEIDEAGFLRQMTEEQRLIYEFEPLRVYGAV